MQSKDGTQIIFQITSLEHGWLFAELSINGQNISLSNSCLGGLELPNALLKAINSLLDGSILCDWIFWDGESCAWIWNLQREGDKMRLRVFQIRGSFGYVIPQSRLPRIVGDAAPILTAETDLVDFAETVSDTFGKYSWGKGLEQWRLSKFGEYFPEGEYRKLRRALREIGR